MSDPVAIQNAYSTLISSGITPSQAAAALHQQAQQAAIVSQQTSPNAPTVPPPASNAFVAQLVKWLVDGTGPTDISVVAQIISQTITGIAAPADLAAAYVKIVQLLLMTGKACLNANPQYQQAAAAAYAAFITANPNP